MSITITITADSAADARTQMAELLGAATLTHAAGPVPAIREAVVAAGDGGGAAVAKPRAQKPKAEEPEATKTEAPQPPAAEPAAAETKASTSEAGSASTDAGTVTDASLDLAASTAKGFADASDAEKAYYTEHVRPAVLAVSQKLQRAGVETLLKGFDTDNAMNVPPAQYDALIAAAQTLLEGV